MSVLLDELIRERKESAIQYANYLQKIVDFIHKLKTASITGSYPTTINTKAKRALYDNLGNNEKLALKVNENIENSKPEGWRGNRIKERQVRNAIREALEQFQTVDEKTVETILELAKNQNEY